MKRKSHRRLALSSLPDRAASATTQIARAISLHRAGELDRASAIYDSILSSEPLNAVALHHRGLLAFHRGNSRDAVELMTRALAVDPSKPEYYNNFAVVLGQIERLNDALELFDEAIRLRPEYADAYCNRAYALHKLDRLDEAAAGWRKAIELDPNHRDAHEILGRFLLKVAQGNDWAVRHPKRVDPRPGQIRQQDTEKMLGEAVQHLHRAAELAPRKARIRFHLGNALRQRGDVPAAIEQFREAIRLRPEFVEAHGNLGAAYNDLAEHGEAITHLEKAISLRDGFVDGHWNLALALLALGEWERGWMEYEWRLALPAEKSKRNRFVHPAWNGCEIRGRRVLVVGEQGLGDTAQFVRYCTLLSRQGAHVILECQKPLLEIAQTCEGVSQVISQGDSPPRFDVYVRLASLPGIFRNGPSDVPLCEPYLRADASRTAEWAERLGQHSSFRVGIAWQGNPGFAYDKTRSIPLREFAPLGNVKGVRLICLQKNHGREQIEQNRGMLKIQLPDPEPDADGGVADTPAIMMNLDLVISSDSFIAHLAGALGVRTWVALSHACDWRWLRGREDCVWYPSMRLFRQSVPGSWREVFDHMAAEMNKEVVRNHLPGTPRSYEAAANTILHP